MQFENGIEIDEVEAGLLVRQHSDAYVARGWRLTNSVTELVQTAISSSLRWMIREGHPQAHARWPSGQGRVYLAFSPTREQHWSVAIDSFRDASGDYSEAVFNGKYHQQFIEHRVPFQFEKRNRGAGHLVVSREHVIPAVQLLADLDHSVLYLGRTDRDGLGFVTEYDIQRMILFGWQRTPFAESFDIVADEFPVDGGLNSRRIDILARDPSTGNWLVIELKRAEAKLEALYQIESYMLKLSQRDDFLTGELSGVLVAERISEAVRATARKMGIVAYEVGFPSNIQRVA
jgi:hypothetical protein